MNRYIILILLCLASSALYGNSENEELAITYFKTLQTGRIGKIAPLLHPTAVHKFRVAYQEYIAEAMKQDPITTRAALLDFFQGDDLEAVKSESDEEFLKRTLNYIDLALPQLAVISRNTEYQLVGSVTEGEMEHFIFRASVKHKSMDFSKLEIITVIDHNGTPKIQSDAILNQLNFTSNQ